MMTGDAFDAASEESAPSQGREVYHSARRKHLSKPQASLKQQQELSGEEGERLRHSSLKDLKR